jgi:uracil phosphoribosyltransferase
LGIFREKVSLQPVECQFYLSELLVWPTITFDTDYSKLPPSPPVDSVFVLDPLIATGGTAIAALNMITEWGIPGIYALSRGLH